MTSKILIWDNDGTVTGSKDPNDATRIILPHVEAAMQAAPCNFIVSGFKCLESERQNFDPEKVIVRFTDLMTKLPISAAAFSPAIGGVACYVVIKHPSGEIEVRKAHEDPRYQAFIGDFKKPGVGMFVVIRDIALELFGQIISDESVVMVGDTWHDEKAACDFGIPFIDAKRVHSGEFDTR